MLLSKLLSGIEYTDKIFDQEISSVTCDSRKTRSGCAFICIKGEHFDGHDLAIDALGKGASAIIVERDINIRGQIIVDNTRFAYGKMCDNFYGNPSAKLKTIGFTGTNGKTTSTMLVKNALMSCGKLCGLIGTIENQIGDKKMFTNKTTPDAADLFYLLDEMANEHCSYCVMEVSSHSLAQDRLSDFVFDISVFTNLTGDHLDYHGNMEEYYQAKKRLFLRSKVGIINIDDEYGLRLAGELSDREIITYSANSCSADFYAKDVCYHSGGADFSLVCGDVSAKVRFPMPGKFSVYNALSAAAVLLTSGVSLSKTAALLSAEQDVPGRSEVIASTEKFTVIRDYAHTVDGILNVLSAVKEIVSGRLVAVFGCGGDRDKTKRPKMGEAAVKYADFVVVTSDNPRMEDADSIIDEIMPSVEGSGVPFKRITNRLEAIKWTIDNAEAGDTIVLLGKGHEDYQIIGTEKFPFDEKKIVTEYIN